MEDKKDYTVEYNKALKRIFDSEDGRFVLNDWKVSYIDKSSLTSNSNETHYHLGRKELVQEIITDINVDMTIILDQQDEEIL